MLILIVDILEYTESEIQGKRLCIRVSNILQVGLLVIVASFLLLFGLFFFLNFLHGFFSDDDEDKIVSNVECHYAQARIGEFIFDLGDCAYIKV